MSLINPKIFIAFRFHVNFYHSYRGDTPDKYGFGPDMRIIRNTIDVLDEFNLRGVAACGTWDIENYFSLETIMPRHCPDIIESWKRRVLDGRDEVEVMSYNNGLISAHTPAEFDAAIGRAIRNNSHSGLADIFPSFAPIVRPQEMMYTPVHLKMYQRHGISCISLFYSSVPFNSFSNFIPPLSIQQRFNPLTLLYPGFDETMTLLPAYNHGDVSDNISLRHWVKRLRKEQMRLSEPVDLLLLIDADADDEYWYGYNWPVVSKIFSAARGLRGLVQSVSGLDYVAFTTPGRYLETHAPLGSIRIGQDTADGAFDGFSSWAEKRSNHQLWTGIERSRVLELQTRRLLEFVKKKEERKDIERLLAESFESRLKCMSTTHFGLSSPVMNVTRLKTGAQLARSSLQQASRAFSMAAEAAAIRHRWREKHEAIEFSLVDYTRGISTEVISFAPKPSRALMRIRLSINNLSVPAVSSLECNGQTYPCAIRPLGVGGPDTQWELLFLERMNGEERKDFQLVKERRLFEAPLEGPAASVTEKAIQNEFIALDLNRERQPVKLQYRETTFSDGPFLRSAFTYKGATIEAGEWRALESAVLGNGLVAFERTAADVEIDSAPEGSITIRRELLLASGMPYLYVHTEVKYPRTESNNYSAGKARRLQTRYDNNWREVIPCELRPALFGQKDRPLKIWKHNYCGHTSHYVLDYGNFSLNSALDSFNNHVTHAWIAVSDGEKGLLVAQSCDWTSCFAFCPMRVRLERRGNRIFLNPFGSYYGRQLNYVTAHTGLGKMIALKMADHLDPSAPSYNGQTERFALMIAPYLGDEPPESIRNDAEAFAYPYAVVSSSEAIVPPAHRNWSFLGETTY